MIICPHCQIELKNDNDFYTCGNCKYNAKKSNGILSFNPEIQIDLEDYPSEGLDVLFKYEQSYFWFLYRKKLIKRFFKKYIDKKSKILEIGAGTGNIASSLIAEGYNNYSVGEIHFNGLEYSKMAGIHNLYQFDLLKSPFKEQFDVVTMFDVIEHLSDDNLALKNVHNILTKNGKVIITVPAHKWLWSNIDIMSGHKRRYSQEMIRKLLEKNGFNVLIIKNFFIFTLPFMYIRTMQNKRVQKIDLKNAEKRSGFKINFLVNFAFKLLTFIEDILFYFISPKIGSSIIIIGIKNDPIQ